LIEVDLYKKLKSADNHFDFAVNFTIESGAFVSVYGPSGAGKTTLLKLMSGLLSADSGFLTFNGDSWIQSEQKVNMPPKDRSVGFVFQDYALFPNMTVWQNLEFGLQKGDSTALIEELIELMELEKLRNRKPNTLSGGEQQRVALARALVQKPSLLLLDEPFSALDNEIRNKLHAYIIEVHRKYGLTTVLVTHDLAEVFKLSNQVIKMEAGGVVKTGSPIEVFATQASSSGPALIGQVLSIETQNEKCFAKILVGNHIGSYPISEEKEVSLSVGSKVMISLDPLKTNIVKIQD
jgi:molybdate transport system ATP-binding protein